MQIEHKTEKGTLCFVKVPDGLNKVRFLETLSELELISGDVVFGKSYEYLKINHGFQLIGLTSEVTEEQWCKTLPEPEIIGEIDNGLHVIDIFGYIDYLDEENSYETAKESGQSLMQHLQIYEVNPIEKPNIMHYHPHDSSYYKIEKQKFQQAELHTGKWVVLFKPNEK